MAILQIKSSVKTWHFIGFQSKRSLKACQCPPFTHVNLASEDEIWIMFRLRGKITTTIYILCSTSQKNGLVYRIHSHGIAWLFVVLS